MMANKTKVLFLCTGNCCRSQMAEAILREVGGAGFEAFSAGSHPAGYVHPLAIEALARRHISLDGQESKSWDEFADDPVDLVVTVCDAAAGEACPTWPGRPLTAHWGVADPAHHPGNDQDRMELAVRVAERLRAKITAMVQLDFSSDRETLKTRLDHLGDI